MAFTVKYGAYKQVGYDGTFCDVTEPIWSVGVVITQLFAFKRTILCRPKLFGYGAMPLIYVVPGMCFTVFSISRLKRMMKAHQLLWNDMANTVRFAQPPAPSQSAKRPHLTPNQGLEVDDGSPNSTSYHLVQLHAPPGLDASCSSQTKPHSTGTFSSGLDSSVMTDDSSVITHTDTKSRRLSTSNADTESNTDPATPAIDGDVSSYGSAPSKSA